MTLKILLVEDHEDWQDILQEEVEQAVQEMHLAWEIRVIGIFEEAWRSLGMDGPWHLLVTDIGLGGENVSSQKRGIRLIERAHRLEVPSLAVSGTPLEKHEVRDLLKVHGADDFFDKSHFNSRDFGYGSKRLYSRAATSNNRHHRAGLRKR